MGKVTLALAVVLEGIVAAGGVGRHGVDERARIVVHADGIKPVVRRTLFKTLICDQATLRNTTRAALSIATILKATVSRTTPTTVVENGEKVLSRLDRIKSIKIERDTILVGIQFAHVRRPLRPNGFKVGVAGVVERRSRPAFQQIWFVC